MNFDYSYEQGIARLEQISNLLAAGNSTLDESLALFKEASELIVYCENLLKKAELAVESMSAGFDGEQNV
ncbi:MAG: exodeoxyribonuclease VII small subunit [Oscillospiraceae bacterium]